MGNGMLRLWLVRHGATEWNTEQRMCGHSDIPLSKTGRTQARWLARQLQQEQITALYTSDLVRAQETAEIIATSSTHALPIHVSSAWREIAFGAWEGLSYTAIEEQFKDTLGFFTDPERCSPPGGETLSDVLRRVQPAFHELQTHAEGDVVLVSHGGTLRALLCHVLGIPLNQQWQVRIDPGSLSILDLLPAPQESESFPKGILTLLNMQRPKRIHRAVQQKLSSTTED